MFVYQLIYIWLYVCASVDLRVSFFFVFMFDCDCFSVSTGMYENIINKTGNVCHITMKIFTLIRTYSLQFCILVCSNINFFVTS